MSLDTQTEQMPYTDTYYSAANPAYPEGYSLESRRDKYSDVLDNIQGNLPGPLLDVGSGPGFLIHLLRERGYEAFGCDFSPAAIERVPPATRPYIVLADLRQDLPFQTGSFASTSAFHVLEHLDDREVEVALRELSRVTREKFYGIIPTTDGIAERDEKVRKQVMDDPTHRALHNRAWWIEKFKDTGWYENTSLSQQFDRKKYGWVFVMNRGVV